MQRSRQRAHVPRNEGRFATNVSSTTSENRSGQRGEPGIRISGLPIYTLLPEAGHIIQSLRQRSPLVRGGSKRDIACASDSWRLWQTPLPF
jgi:hypothetical protein